MAFLARRLLKRECLVSIHRPGILLGPGSGRSSSSGRLLIEGGPCSHLLPDCSGGVVGFIAPPDPPASDSGSVCGGEGVCGGVGVSGLLDAGGVAVGVGVSSGLSGKGGSWNSSSTSLSPPVPPSPSSGLISSGSPNSMYVILLLGGVAGGESPFAPLSPPDSLTGAIAQLRDVRTCLVM